MGEKETRVESEGGGVLAAAEQIEGPPANHYNEQPLNSRTARSRKKAKRLCATESTTQFEPKSGVHFIQN
jgi:hypothetical protein